MTRYDGQDRYVDAVTGVLRNRLGIRDPEDLRQAEASLAAWRSFELALEPLPGSLDFAHLQALHARLFGDLYDWAGQVRDVEIAKGSCRFAGCRHIPAAAEAIFEQLAREGHLQGLGAEAFAARAGHYLGEINALHPFRDGNGRTQREFIGMLARQNGWRIAWEKVDAAEMIEASKASLLHGDNSGLARIIRDNLRPLPQGAPDSPA
ncbi:MAG TPA: Fic family protein [Solidesulfovibrio magneticus]|nr:Fic family protein [Solidesulfovibrio magneticus]